MRFIVTKKLQLLLVLGSLLKVNNDEQYNK